MFLYLVLLAVFLGSLFLLTGNLKKHRIIPWIFIVYSLLLQSTPRSSLLPYIIRVLVIAAMVASVTILKKKSYLWLYLLIIPVIAGFMWHYHTYYAGVVNPQWPLTITAIALVVSMYFSDSTKIAWKIVANCSMLITILVIMTLCMPKYTYNSAKNKISADTGKDISGVHIEKRQVIKSIPAISLCVDHYYVFELVEKGILTTYSFNPETGEWNEWYTAPIEN